MISVVYVNGIIKLNLRTQIYIKIIIIYGKSNLVVTNITRKIINKNFLLINSYENVLYEEINVAVCNKLFMTTIFKNIFGHSFL